nr:MAG TPA: hypothetical protein [Caudoviricetes sp.]
MLQINCIICPSLFRLEFVSYLSQFYLKFNSQILLFYYYYILYFILIHWTDCPMNNYS